MKYFLVRLGPLVVVAIGTNLLLVERVLPAFPSHTFDTNSQGWKIAGSSTDYGPPTTDDGADVAWDNRGNPGGALSLGDYYYATWISAPAPFLGNQADMFGKAFSYDIRIRYTDTTSFPYPTAAIRSGSLTLLYTIATPPLDTWQTRVVTFDPALWTVDVGQGAPTPGATATAAQMQSVLGNLEKLYLLTEWRTGPDDTSVDNIGVGFSTGLEGDYNLNGAVGAADFVLWRHSLGSVYTQNDYVIWRSHFGQTAGSGTALPSEQLAAVPEASAISLLAWGSVAVAMRPCRRRRGG